MLQTVQVERQSEFLYTSILVLLRSKTMGRSDRGKTLTETTRKVFSNLFGYNDYLSSDFITDQAGDQLLIIFFTTRRLKCQNTGEDKRFWSQ